MTFFLSCQGKTAHYFLLLFCLQQITRPSQEDKSDDKNEEDKSEKSEKKEDEEKKDEEEKDEKEDTRWVVDSMSSWCHGSINCDHFSSITSYLSNFIIVVTVSWLIQFIKLNCLYFIIKDSQKDILLLIQKQWNICFTDSLESYVVHLQTHRDIGKDKDKCDGGEDEDGKEQNTPRGRKTANSQGRRKGRITTRSMANEAASVAAEEAPPPTSEPALPDPLQLPKGDPAQKAMKEPAKPQTPIASLDANKGNHLLYCIVEQSTLCNGIKCFKLDSKGFWYRY